MLGQEVMSIKGYWLNYKAMFNARNTAINRAARDFLSPFFEGTGQQNPFSDFTASQTSGADAFAREAALENLLGQQFGYLRWTRWFVK